MKPYPWLCQKKDFSYLEPPSIVHYRKHPPVYNLNTPGPFPAPPPKPPNLPDPVTKYLEQSNGVFYTVKVRCVAGTLKPLSYAKSSSATFYNAIYQKMLSTKNSLDNSTGKCLSAFCDLLKYYFLPFVNEYNLEISNYCGVFFFCFFDECCRAGQFVKMVYLLYSTFNSLSILYLLSIQSLGNQWSFNAGFPSTSKTISGKSVIFQRWFSMP